MTAPGGGGADEIREQLAEALAGHQGLVGPRDQERPSVWFRWCICGWDGGPLAAGEASNDGRSYRAHLADVLLADGGPVRALIAKGAAAELRGLLPSIDERATASRFQAVGIYCRELARKIRDRADALDGTP